MLINLYGYTQISPISGKAKVDAGSSQLYVVSTGCETKGYCWSATNASTAAGSCTTGFAPDSVASILPPSGNCGCSAQMQITFNNVTTLSNASIRVNDNCGYSTSMVVTIVPALANNIAVSPASQRVACYASPTTLSSSLPSGGDGTYQYQWQQSPDNLNWLNISGATGNTYTPPSIAPGSLMYYRVQVTSFDYTVFSVAAIVEGVTAPLIPGAISNTYQTINYNTVPAVINCSPASGGSCSTVSYSYQWQQSGDGSTWTNIIGATAQNYSPPALTATTYYRRIDAYNGQSVYSNSAQIVVSPELKPGNLYDGPRFPITYNTAFGALSGSLASGGNCNGSYSYQWEMSVNGGPAVAISGATRSAYDPGNLTQTTSFRRKVTCGALTAYTGWVKIMVAPQLQGGTVASILNIAYNTSPGALSNTAASDGNCGGSYAYQWQQSADGYSWIDIAGAIMQNYTPGNLKTTTYYRRKVSCDIETAYTNNCQVIVGPQPPDVNYVRSREVLRPGITSAENAAALTNVQELHQSTVYFDGLGRPVQTVVKQGSLPTSSGVATDLVSPIIYDAFAREAQKYLPYASNITDGEFKTNALAEQNSFNQSLYPTEHYYYGKTDFEASPLNRTLATYAPGDSWVGAGRGVQNGYWFNTDQDQVHVWTVTNSATTTGFGTYSTSATALYAPGTLYKNVTVDEHQKQVIEFKDKDGHVILKKVQLTAAADDGKGSSYTGWLCTYYVYDDLEQLRAVIQPNAVQAMAAASLWTLNGTQLNELCFRYEYDARGRMILKKVPGAAAVLMIYDARDRLVMTQDGYLKYKHKYAYTQYDDQNRMIATGLITDQANYNNPDYHRGLAATSTAYPDLSLYPGNVEELTHTFYDDYNWRTAYGNLPSSTRDATYDSYLLTSSATASPFPVTPVQSIQIKGLVTGSRTKVVGTTTYLYTINIYDDKGRVIQQKSTNYTGGTDIVSTQYDFTGKVLKNHLSHQKSGVNPHTYQVLTTSKYDVLGRLAIIEKSCSVDGAIAITNNRIAQYSYDALGRMSVKGLGQNLKYSDLPMESLVYNYNIRGWLTGINKDYLNAPVSSMNYFGMELDYDRDGYAPNGSKQYNGNIGSMIWRSRGDGQQRKYQFGYDAMNRLLSADFTEQSGTAWSNTSMNFSVKMGDGLNASTAYDANGNILKMQQWGWKLSGSTLIDDLSYSYFSNSNKLQAVSESPANPVVHNLGDFTDKNTTATDYGYDLNGNMVTDLNKRLNGNTGLDQQSGGAIGYNYMNLPDVVTVKTDDGAAIKGTITYTYDAAGNKLRKVVVENPTSVNGNIKTTTTTLYIGGFVYESKVHVPAQADDYTDRLQFILHEEGRIRPTAATGFVYDYFIKDHLRI
jgi:hypothetical protein